MPDRKRNVKTMYNIARLLRAPGGTSGDDADVGETVWDRGTSGTTTARGGSTQFIKESTARNLRLLLTPGCRNLCELLTKEWRSFRSRTHRTTTTTTITTTITTP